MQPSYSLVQGAASDIGCILRALPLDPKSMGRRKHVEPLCRAVTQTVRKDDHKCRSLYVFPLRYTTNPSEANSTPTALPNYGKQRVLLGYVISTTGRKSRSGVTASQDNSTDFVPSPPVALLFQKICRRERKRLVSHTSYQKTHLEAITFLCMDHSIFQS